MRYYLAHGHGAWGMGHGAWGMGHGAWGMGHGASGIRPTGIGPTGIGHTSPRLRTAITQVSAGAGLLNFLVCIRDFDEPASR